MAIENYISPENLLAAPLFAPEQLGKQIGNALVLAPHPDDEVLGCGGLIQFLLEQKMEIVVCFITSGNASHPNSKKFPSKKLGDLREGEARTSCKILGVATENIIFLKQPDSLLESLDESITRTLNSKIAEIIRNHNISSIILPWRRDPHPDHRATFLLGKNAAKLVDEPIQLMEYPIWLWKNSHKKDWPRKNEVEIYRLDVLEKKSKKVEAIHAHKSQTSTLIDDDPQGFILTDDLLSPFLTSFEFYFFDKKENMKSLTEEYFKSLYSHNPDPWNFRNSEYEKQKYETIDKYLKNRFYKNGLELGCAIGVHTSHLAAHCEKLLAVDISEDAISTAKETIQIPNVKFKTMDVSADFPKASFDFISMCEMGYYFDLKTLAELFNNISESLKNKGQFLMVHWTSYVREYPLSGKRVHELFSELNKEENLFTLISSSTEDRYELVLWQKN